MKTGFIHGFPNKPGKKRYSYHGVDRDCLIQPSPDPFDEYPFIPPGPPWVLAWEGSLHTPLGGIITKNPDGFLYSSDPHPCANKTFCDKNQYYFCEVILYRRLPRDKMTMAWSDGLNCMLSWNQGDWDYWYRAWFNYRWCGNSFLFWVYKAGAGSWGKIWKSENGEFPGGYPVPPGEEHY